MQVGKTTLSLMLSNIYPNASLRESVYVTNKSLEEILSLEKFNVDELSVEKGINVITSLIETDNIRESDLIDYAYRPNYTKAMLFDIYSTSISKKESNLNFMNVIKKLGSRFIVLDINGDPNSEEVSELLDNCDVVLYVFKPTKKEALSASKYYNSLEETNKIKTKLVCNMLDPIGISRKTIQDVIKIRANQILWFPYHVNIQRTMFEGRLCRLNSLIIEGKDNCISLRQPLKDILSFCCDTSAHKVIKELKDWILG
jgi:cellulose biosynthesis protein BcsQ